MLDNPKKTEALMAALKAAIPFEVELTPEVVKQLQAQSLAHADQTHCIVSDLSYAGDEGGIVCHIVPLDKKEALFISITHVRMPRTMPLAAAVVDYQKHRVKKLRKQGTTKRIIRPYRFAARDAWKLELAQYESDRGQP